MVGSEISHKNINRVHTTLPMYVDKQKNNLDRDDGILNEDVMQVFCDNVSLCISRSSNMQIRSEVSIIGGEFVENAFGFIVTPMNTKQCRVKKLNSTKQLLKQKQPSFKKQICEKFNLINTITDKSSSENVLKINSY